MQLFSLDNIFFVAKIASYLRVKNFNWRIK